MITERNIMDAFLALAPEIMTGTGPEEAMRKRNLDPDSLATVSNNLVHMYAGQNTPPEEAVPASLAIGVLVGLELAKETMMPVHSEAWVSTDHTPEGEGHVS